MYFAFQLFAIKYIVRRVDCWKIAKKRRESRKMRVDSAVMLSFFFFVAYAKPDSATMSGCLLRKWWQWNIIFPLLKNYFLSIFYPLILCHAKLIHLLIFLYTQTAKIFNIRCTNIFPCKKHVYFFLNPSISIKQQPLYAIWIGTDIDLWRVSLLKQPPKLRSTLQIKHNKHVSN